MRQNNNGRIWIALTVLLLIFAALPGDAKPRRTSGSADEVNDFLEERDIREAFLSRNGRALAVLEWVKDVDRERDEYRLHLWRLTGDTVTKSTRRILFFGRSEKPFTEGTDVVLSPDGRLAAVQKKHMTSSYIDTYDLETADLVHRVPIPSDRPASLAISPDNTELAVCQPADRGGRIRLHRFSLKDGQKIYEGDVGPPPTVENGNNYGLTYTPDGEYILLQGRLRKLLHRKSMKMVSDLEDRIIYNIVFKPRTNNIYHMVSGECSLELELFDPVEDKTLETTTGLDLSFMRVAVDGDGLVAVEDRGELEQWFLNEEGNALNIRVESFEGDYVDIAYNREWNEWIVLTEKRLHRLEVPKKEEIRAKNLFDEGKQLFRIGFYEAAVDTLKEAITLAPLKVDDIRHIDSLLLPSEPDTNIPLRYLGEVYLHYYRVLEEKPENKDWSAWTIFRLINYGILSAHAGYPALTENAVTRIQAVSDRFPENEVLQKWKVDAETLLNALKISLEQGSGPAYQYLLKRHRQSKLKYHKFYLTGYRASYFTPLYEDREKLAFFLGKEASELPTPGKVKFENQAFVDFHGNIIKPLTKRPKLQNDADEDPAGEGGSGESSPGGQVLE